MQCSNLIFDINPFESTNKHKNPPLHQMQYGNYFAATIQLTSVWERERENALWIVIYLFNRKINGIGVFARFAFVNKKLLKIKANKLCHLKCADGECIPNDSVLSKVAEIKTNRRRGVRTVREREKLTRERSLTHNDKLLQLALTTVNSLHDLGDVT